MMEQNQQPEALRLAQELNAAICHLNMGFVADIDTYDLGKAALELESLYARNQELEGMLDSVGAGGVSAQRVTQDKWASDPSKMLRIKAIQQAADHVAQDSKMVAAPVEVVIDFERVGSAGPFAVVEGRVAIPVVTMLDLARMLKPTTDALSAAQVVLPEPAAVVDYYSQGGENDQISAFLPIGTKLYTEQQVRELLDKAACTKSQAAAQEPFGYFKAEPFGWRDCAETDEGAIALYDAPQPQADARDAERLDALYKALEVCSAELFAQCAHQGRAMKYVEQARKALAAEQFARAAIAKATGGAA